MKIERGFGLSIGLALAACATLALAQDEPLMEKDHAPFPEPDSGYVSDLAALLSPALEREIESWLWDVETGSGVEIIVVTIGSIEDYPGTGARSVAEFARGLFDAYGIGNMPRNDGVLLLVARDDREARIELGAAYGRSRDDDAARIMDGVIIPAFKAGNYPDGIRDGVKALMREFADMRVGLNRALIGVLAAIPVVALVAISLFRSGKKGWGWVCVGFLIVLVLAAFWLARKAYTGGGLAGGAGGFGGGFSGGGGAGGSW